MNDVAVKAGVLAAGSRHKVRFLTAANLFDGHDASINIMRRIPSTSSTWSQPDDS
jgi:methylmalonyl-CoA mutase cobalamin-binding subunit